jgi:hypothetical protein
MRYQAERPNTQFSEWHGFIAHIGKLVLSEEWAKVARPQTGLEAKWQVTDFDPKISG